MRGFRHILYLLLLAWGVYATPAKAELTTPLPSMNESTEEDDRRRRNQEAARQGDQETDKQLQPQKTMHDMKQMEHLRRAEEARNNKDEGTAQREQQMAMMEQMKSQQLQQQINTNKDTAQKNRQAADKLTETDSNSGEKAKSYDPSVVKVRDGKSAAKEGSTEKEAENPAEVADLSSVPRDLIQPPTTTQAAPAEPAAPPAPPGPPATERLLGELDRMDRQSVTFDDGAKRNSNETTPQVRLLSAASGGGTPSGTSATGGANGGGTGDTNIWEATSKGQATAAAAPTHTKGARGLSSLLGAGGEAGSSSMGALDKDFFDPCPGPEAWKKMSRGEKNGVRESCRKVAQKCEKEDASAAKQTKKSARSTKKAKTKMSAQCREWKDSEKDKGKENKDASAAGERRARADR